MTAASHQSRAPDAGFTLIEALVAMAVLALGSVSLLTATEGHTARISALTDRMAARWAAEARLTDLRLGLTAAPETQMLGRDWIVRQAVGETTDPDLARVIVNVAPANKPDSPMVTLTGYVARADLPEEL